jgi:hypothetical protein
MFFPRTHKGYKCVLPLPEAITDSLYLISFQTGQMPFSASPLLPGEVSTASLQTVTVPLNLIRSLIKMR